MSEQVWPPCHATAEAARETCRQLSAEMPEVACPCRNGGTTVDQPCDRCAFIPTPDGKCICRMGVPAEEMARLRTELTEPPQVIPELLNLAEVEE